MTGNVTPEGSAFVRGCVIGEGKLAAVETKHPNELKGAGGGWVGSLVFCYILASRNDFR